MNDSELWFRPMTLSDVERVMTVEQEVYEFPWTDRIFSDCIRVGYHCWLALLGRDLAGHAIISITAGECHILNLSIARRFQRRGFGRQFIEFLIEDARNSKAETILLEVRPSNTAAINCYHAAGFNEIGNRKDYYPAKNGREDALLYARHIPPLNNALTN